MISLKCPHCHVGLKVDEGKLPSGIEAFKCPKCKSLIPISMLSEKEGDDSLVSDTTLLLPVKKTTGRLTVIPDAGTQEQIFPLSEGIAIIGRKSSRPSRTTISIQTTDRSMSREHIRIEVKKDVRGGYKHYLSDNNSKNHTLYNSNFLENEEVVILNNNDEIIIGRTVLRFNE
ncbi:MAG: FHA domain-containing protein [Tannerellaceae bacterium]|jgi:pSer/pThr/pTyr-binding forkhead associated (FHA) protein|nr:FHA domain-containing protein [Tannerellaceae bacterium]